VSTTPVNCVGGCSFFGNPTTFNYCSLCYKKLPQLKIQELTNLEKAQIEIDKALKNATRQISLANLEKDYEIKFYHFNGLPPAGPRLSAIYVSRKINVDAQSDDINTLKNVAMIVQRKWVGTEIEGTWMYEVAQRYDKEFKPPNEGIPNEKWRCNACVVNQLFGFNDAGNMLCNVCNKSINDVGQTVWVKYNQLNALLRREVDTNYQPKIVSLLHTRWPKTTVEYGGQKPPTI